MDSLPEEVMREIFSHLWAFDAHRLGMTSWKARKVILEERKLVYVVEHTCMDLSRERKFPEETSLYKGWYEEMKAKVCLRAKDWMDFCISGVSRTYKRSIARDVERWFASNFKDELGLGLQENSSFAEAAWQIITGEILREEYRSLDHLVFTLVRKIEEKVTYGAWYKCIGCKLLNRGKDMYKEGPRDDYCRECYDLYFGGD